MGLGQMKENWNLGHHWREVYDPINIPELRDPKLQKETDNFATCGAKLVKKDTGLLTKDQEKVSFRL